MGGRPSEWDSLAASLTAHRAQAYAQLALACGDDPQLAAAAAPLLPVLAALRRASFAGGASDPWLGDVDALRHDLEARAGDVEAARADGLVQFTEPLRMADLLPALLLAACRYPDRQIRLVEFGACAGILLAPEHYRIDYPTGKWSTHRGAIDLTSDLAVPPSLLAQPLDIEARLGIDLRPVDVRDPGAFDHLRSFAWPGDDGREARLARALTGLRDDPPPLVAGDAVDVLPDVLDDWVAPERLTVVVESAVSRYLPPPAVLRLGRTLDRHGSRGPLVLIERVALPPADPTLPWGVRMVDLHQPHRCDVARSDLLSERTVWAGPAG